MNDWCHLDDSDRLDYCSKSSRSPSMRITTSASRGSVRLSSKVYKAQAAANPAKMATATLAPAAETDN